jgi:hypothetical protein
MSSPHQQTPEFDRQNNFLWFLLGLHSIASTIREQLSPAPSVETPIETEIAKSAAAASGSLLR